MVPSTFQETATTEIEEVSMTGKGIRRFLEFSYSIYDENSPWVAPLLFDLRKVFTKENPLFEHAEMKLWMARRGSRDVGRISALFDRSGGPAGFFGFFESVDDTDVACRLVGAASGWLKSQGLSKVMGPMNPTTNDECGLLVKGHEFQPSFMMPYNPPYYAALLEGCGMTKAKDLLAYDIDLAGIPMDRLSRIAGKVKARNPELTFRPIRRKTLEQDLSQVKKIYNEAWESNWGFIPMTDSEINFMAERLKPMLMEGLVWLVEKGSEPVAFLLATPDYNIPMKPLRGRLLTPAIFGFLPYFMGRKYPPAVRVLTLGVKESYRGKGLESAMLIEGLKVGCAQGFQKAEASWILEDNTAMCRVIEAIGGKVYKRYRIYEKQF